MTDQATTPPAEMLDPPAERHRSEYIAAREEWDDRFAGQRKTVRVLTGITILALALGGLGMGYGIHTGARTQFLPYVLQVDELGRVGRALLPEPAGKWPPPVIRRELDLFVERLRSVSPDLNVIGDNHRAVEKFLLSGSPAATKIRTYFQDPRNDPLTRAASETVAVEVISINSLSDATWRIEWRETLFSSTSGKQIDSRRFVATTQIEFHTPRSHALLAVNPLGMFILDLDIQEVRT